MASQLDEAHDRAARHYWAMKPAIALFFENPRGLPKALEKFSLELVPARDILKSLPRSRNFFVVGFAAETNDLEKHARAKLATKNCDMMVANDLSDPNTGMESDENAITIFLHDGESEKISRASKKIIARELVKIICANAKKVLTKKI